MPSILVPQVIFIKLIKVFKYNALHWGLILWQLCLLCITPQQIYRHVLHTHLAHKKLFIGVNQVWDITEFKKSRNNL